MTRRTEQEPRCGASRRRASRTRSRATRGAALTAAGAMIAGIPAAAIAAHFAGATIPTQTDVASARGVVSITVRCPAGTSKGCGGRLSLRTEKKVHGKTQSLGSATFSIAPGKSAKVKLKLNAEGVKLVQGGLITPVATASSQDGSRHRARHSTTISLRSDVYSTPPPSAGY